MKANQKMRDEEGYQVALFPLEYIYVSQADNGSYSHEGGSWYWATDYLGWGASGRIYRCPVYAPVDIKCIYVDKGEAMATWESLEKVHLANDTIDYLGVIVYHDNDVANGLITVGTKKYQGEQFDTTGTGGSATGDHVHLETGYGKYTQPNVSTGRGTPNYKYHFTDYTDVKRLHNYNALFINDTVNVHSPDYYTWTTYNGDIPPIPPLPPLPSILKTSKFPFVLYSRKNNLKRKTNN